MTQPTVSLLEQLEEIERNLANIVTQEDVFAMEKAKDVIPKLQEQIKRAQRAGLNSERLSSLQDRLQATNVAINNWLREYRT